MTSPDDATISSRLAALERAHRRLRVTTWAAVAAAVAAGALVVLLGTGRLPATQVRSGAFVLLAEDGAVAGGLSVTPDGALLTLEPGRAGARITLGNAEEHAGLGVLHEKTGDGLMAVTSAFGAPAVSASAGKNRVIVGADGNGPSVSFVEDPGRRSIVTSQGMSCISGAVEGACRFDADGHATR